MHIDSMCARSEMEASEGTTGPSKHSGETYFIRFHISSIPDNPDQNHRHSAESNKQIKT